jgi:hypothetical protein
VAPGYVTTIHRQQGATLIRAGLWLTTSIFAHGLLYTALSRVGSSAHIRVSVKNIYGVQGTFPGETGTYIRNVYYEEMDDLIGDTLMAYPDSVPGRSLSEHGVEDTMERDEALIAESRANHNAYVTSAITARIASRLNSCRQSVAELTEEIAALRANAASTTPPDFPVLGLKVMVCTMCGDGPVCSFPRTLQRQGHFEEEMCGSCGGASGLCHVCFYTAASRCSACDNFAKTARIRCDVSHEEEQEPAAPCELAAAIGTSHQFCVVCTPHLVVCALCRGPIRGGRANVTPPSYFQAQAQRVLNAGQATERTLILQRLNRAVTSLTEAQAQQQQHQ